MTTADIASAFLLGLAGAGHCLGMCGGIAIALQGKQPRSTLIPFSYHAGRVISYALIGALIGTAAGAIQLAGWTIALRFIAGFLLIAMGLHTLRLWQGMAYLERLGGSLWKRISPVAQRFMPPQNPVDGLLLGAIWGLMPCGLIYSALSWSAAAGSGPVDSGLLMLIFGLGTTPAMLGATLLGQRASRFLGSLWVRKTLGTLLVLAGCWTIWLTASHLDHLTGAHSNHGTGMHGTGMNGTGMHETSADGAGIGRAGVGGTGVEGSGNEGDGMDGTALSKSDATKIAPDSSDKSDHSAHH